jgi:hypothetical protein
VKIPKADGKVQKLGIPANSLALSIALPLVYFDSLGLPRLFAGLA